MASLFGARNELSIPEKVRGDRSAAELIRAWVTASGDVHVTIKTDVWRDPAAYGIVLADLARHIANGFHQSQGKDVAEALRRVVEGFSAEIGSPTDTPTGQIQQP
jgi:hypothetical protein